MKIFVERVFYRSFKYELDCLEESRLDKLYRKMEREEIEENEKNKIIEEKSSRNVDNLGVKTCKDYKPFWWKDKNEQTCNDTFMERKASEGVSYEFTDLRWQEEPNLTEFKYVDPCKRQREMAL